MKGRVTSASALLAEFVTAACVATGQTAEVVTRIVAPIVDHLQRNYPGEQIYISKPGRELDLQQIYREYLDRIPKREICRRHSLSMRTLTRIIDEAIDN
jgi:hypothetical protein